MRYILILLLVGGCYLSLVGSANALVIYQGPGQATVKVNNTVEGNGSVSTYIKTEVNGNTHVFTSDDQGSVQIHADDNSYVVTQNGTSSADATISATPTDETKMHDAPKHIPEGIFSRLFNLLQHLLSFF